MVFKSWGLSASVSFLSSPPPPRSFTCATFLAVFDSRSSFFFLLNRTETLATQATAEIAEFYSAISAGYYGVFVVATIVRLVI